MSLLDVFANDFAAMIGDLPITVTHSAGTFEANRSAFRRTNSLDTGGLIGDVSMTIIARYNAITQQVDLGDIVTIDASKFRVTSAELAHDGISVQFDLEDVNR